MFPKHIVLQTKLILVKKKLKKEHQLISLI